MLEAVLLGVVQGLTEFLPVSSTGHLILAEKLLGISEENFGLFFDVMLHGGTLLALVLFFRKDLLRISSDFIKEPLGVKGNLGRILIIGTVPAVIIGVLGEKIIENYLRVPWVVAIGLLVFSLVFWVGEKISKKNREIGQLKNWEAVFIGICQGIAFIPGVSRSGITITGGLFKNLKREEAGRLAFLMSIPVVTGALLKTAAGTLKTHNQNIAESIVGFLVSFVVGFLVIKFFLNYLKRNDFTPFLIYRILLGIVILLFLA